MKTALVAHWPAEIEKAGSDCDSLVSAIDLAPTILELAGLKPARTMQGVSMRPLFRNPSDTIRQYAFSEHNWHDYEALGRSVRSADGMLLIANFRPKHAWQGPADSVRSPSHKQLQRLRDAKELTTAQRDVFLAPRPAIEAYNLGQDPYQLHNLATPANRSAIRKLGIVLQRWMEETGDSNPKDISRDSFNRETGERLKIKGESYRGTTPGEDRNATRNNKPGPR